MYLNNFIFVYYNKQKICSRYKEYFPNVEIDTSIYKQMLTRCCSRIKFLYPNSNIHIISNDEVDLKNTTNHIFPDLPTDHTAKFKIYGLLNVPAMYVDADVLVISKFNNSHLNTSSPINPFTFDLKKTITLANETFNHYNGSVIFIKSPSKKMQKEIEEIHSSTFNTDNDEHAMSYYIHKNKFDIKTFNDVSYNRLKIKRVSDLFNFQSIHYSLPKHLFEKESQFIQKMSIKLN